MAQRKPSLENKLAFWRAVAAGATTFSVFSTWLVWQLATNEKKILAERKARLQLAKDYIDVILDVTDPELDELKEIQEKFDFATWEHALMQDDISRKKQRS